MINWEKGRYVVAPILRGHREKVTAMDSDGKLIPEHLSYYTFMQYIFRDVF
jgi:hypothetical protein